MYIPKEIIEEVRDRSNIEEIIKRYIPSLKIKGKNYVGLCPFHKEKTPSFNVSPEKQIFHCFGCNEGGNVFTFISKMERLDFPESVKFVADIVGIEIKPEYGTRGTQFNEIQRINSYAVNLFHNFLKSSDGKAGMNYLLNRGIARDSIDVFKIGYTPDSWDFLTNRLKKHNTNLTDAERIGLVSCKKGSNHYYDKFRNRVIFPIFDKNNTAIAFGGRVIGNGDNSIKYINSTESEVFKKRNTLYGFNLSKEYVTDLNRAIIVEGYLDVIGCYQAGIKNIVAPLGTALSTSQIQLLARYCSEIILLFDADSAGINAALRSLDIINEINVDVKIAMLPEGDPFDFISTKGVREFMVIVDSALKPVDFKISRIMIDSENNEKVKTMIKLFSVIKNIDLETEKSLYLKKTSSLLNIDENSIRTDFRNYLKKGYMKKITDVDNVSIEKNDFITQSYRALIMLICNYPELIEKASIEFSVEDIPDEISRNIFQKISELYNSNETYSIDKIFDFFHDGEEIKFLNIAINSKNILTNPDSAYTEIYLNMKLHEIENKINQYAESLKNSDEDKHKYLAEIEVLRREKEKLSHYIYNK